MSSKCTILSTHLGPTTGVNLKGGSQALWTASKNDAPPIIPRRKLVGVVDGPLEDGAVNDALVALAADGEAGSVT